MSVTPPDWADDEARKVYRYLVKCTTAGDAIALLAAWARVIRSEGEGKGIQSAAKTVDEVFGRFT